MCMYIYKKRERDIYMYTIYISRVCKNQPLFSGRRFAYVVVRCSTMSMQPLNRENEKKRKLGGDMERKKDGERGRERERERERGTNERT